MMIRFAALCATLLIAATLHAQQEEPKPMESMLVPKFEVATIKAGEPGSPTRGFHTSGTRLFYEHLTATELLTFAYGINRRQIADAPAWFDDQYFDIRGTADQPGVPSALQQQAMLRDLMATRFGLKLHHEQRDMTRILITVANGATKNLHPTTSTDFLADQTCDGSGGKFDCVFTRSTIDDLGGLLQYFLDRPIVDATHLTGRYDFRLKWAREDSPAAGDTGALPSLITAMQEQIGLKAESSKGPVDVLVIDHVEKPSDD